MCNLDLYQDPNARDGYAQRARGEASVLYRQHSCDDRLPRKFKRPHISTDLSPGERRLYSPSRESNHDSNTRDKVLGYDVTHTLLRAPPPRSENQETEGGGQQIEKSRATSFCSGRLKGAMEDECSLTSCSTSTSFLQRYPKRSSKGTREEQPMLQHSLSTLRWGEDRPRLVGTPSSQVEWEVPPTEKTGFENRTQRLPYKVGKPLRKTSGGRALVPIQEQMAHKLPRTTSCYTSSENIPQRSDKQTCLFVSGQHDCSSIHQQPGGNSITPSNHLCKRPLDVVPGERHYSISATPTKEAECDRQSEVKSDERPIRLDAKSKDIPENPGDNGS